MLFITSTTQSIYANRTLQTEVTCLMVVGTNKLIYVDRLVIYYIRLLSSFLFPIIQFTLFLLWNISFYKFDYN